MKFLLLIAYTDLSDYRARIHVDPFEAESDAAAEAFAQQLVGSGKALMDLLVEEWTDIPKLKGLEGIALLAEHGIWVGDIEIWAGDRLVCFLPGVSPHTTPEAA